MTDVARAFRSFRFPTGVILWVQHFTPELEKRMRCRLRPCRLL